MPKLLLAGSGAATAADRRLLNDGIDEVHWVAALKPANAGVPAFRDERREYVEITVVSAVLHAGAGVARLVEWLHRSVPYPVALLGRGRVARVWAADASPSQLPVPKLDR